MNAADAPALVAKKSLKPATIEPTESLSPGLDKFNRLAQHA